MNKSLKTTSFCIAAVGLLHGVSFAQNTLISGDIGTAGNWDDGILPLSSNPANNPGIIDSSNTGANQGTINGTFDNYIIQQTGGDVARTGFGNSIFNTVSWEMTGGTFTSTVLGHQINSSSVFDVNGGTASFSGFTARSSSVVNVTSGTFTTTSDISSQGGAIFNLSGGTVNIGRDAMVGFQPTTTYNFSGTTDVNITRNLGEVDIGTRTITVGAGSGTVDVGNNLEFDGMTIDWATGSGFSFTATNLLDNGVATTWEDMWNAGQLTVDGANSGTFASNFQLTGSTLTLIPEPSTFALVGLAGLTMLAFRRRRG